MARAAAAWLMDRCVTLPGPANGRQEALARRTTPRACLDLPSAGPLRPSTPAPIVEWLPVAQVPPVGRVALAGALERLPKLINGDLELHGWRSVEADGITQLRLVLKRMGPRATVDGLWSGAAGKPRVLPAGAQVRAPQFVAPRRLPAQAARLRRYFRPSNTPWGSAVRCSRLASWPPGARLRIISSLGAALRLPRVRSTPRSLINHSHFLQAGAVPAGCVQ